MHFSTLAKSNIVCNLYLIQIEMLSAEVAALKNLVLTSTPSAPNKHLHPQINNGVSAASSHSGSGKKEKKEKSNKPFWMTHRRSTSHHQYTKEAQERDEASQHHSQLKEVGNTSLSLLRQRAAQH